jgi:hypothetical protein
MSVWVTSSVVDSFAEVRKSEHIPAFLGHEECYGRSNHDLSIMREARGVLVGEEPNIAASRHSHAPDPQSYLGRQLIKASEGFGLHEEVLMNEIGVNIREESEKFEVNVVHIVPLRCQFPPASDNYDGVCRYL